MSRRLVLPVVVLVVACAVAAILLSTGAPVASRPREAILQTVRVAAVRPSTVRLDVASQGTVAPRTESELIPEVAGRVVWTSPALASGGSFAEGELLLRIDPTDYEAAAARARAQLARAEGEHQHAQQVLGRQEDLSSRKVDSVSALNDAERGARVAAAGLDEARVALGQAERDLERTEVRAPFTGRIRTERVDVGQFLNRGEAFATAYATDFVEVRLPIPDAQLAYLEIPFWSPGNASADDLPAVTLRARFAGRDHSWSGQIVRTEGEIDRMSRLVHVVARVANGEVDPSLPVGLFVNATIEGRPFEDLVPVPRQALQGSGEVLVADGEDRLRLRPVELVRLAGDDALVRGDFAAGDRVVVSPVPMPVPGARVRPVVDDAGGARS